MEKAEAVDALDILSGRAEAGATVAMIGGGIVGCETAEFLADRGKKVTIIEVLDSLANGMEGTHRQFLLKRLELRGVTVLTRTKADAVQDEGLMVTTEAGQKRIAADTIVMATGARPNQELYHQLSGKVAEVYLAGDCVEPRGIHEAIAEGFEAGRAI
jgi:pyruvate/2-oxoglutarate dehydrogenase complex dihydrolipoamide dehydrogenase (E3) component